MTTMTTDQTVRPATKAWRAAVAPYEGPILRKSLIQVANSFLPYTVIWLAMYASLSVSYWLTLLLAIPAAGFLVRIFIIAHDCGHQSFFKWRRANLIVGWIGAGLALTPHESWRYQHAVHHATSGNLDRRDLGDVWTLTVKEYEAASWRLRLGYRMYRNPLVMFVVGPTFQFLIANRFYRKTAVTKEKQGIIAYNFAFLGILVLAHFTIGLGTLAKLQLPIMVFAGCAGVWLFYVQHQFEDVYWERTPEWDYVDQALQGSSYYQLPKVLQWFSGNIGFHHVHHLSPRIPNYSLERCHREQEIFRRVPTINLRTALGCLRHRLWDEERRELISFGDLRRRKAMAQN
jgi:omega-6 fatty acid desaturase (delta-12 desaturase)